MVGIFGLGYIGIILENIFEFNKAAIGRESFSTDNVSQKLKALGMTVTFPPSGSFDGGLSLGHLRRHGWSPGHRQHFRIERVV